LFGCVFGLALAGLAARLVYLQAWQREPVGGLAERTQPERMVLPARRGRVLDAQGAEMALSQLGFHVKADPVVNWTNAPELARFAAPLLGVPEGDLLRRITPTPKNIYRYSIATNRVGLLTTNVAASVFVDRDVIVASNLPPQQWEAFRTAMRQYVFAEERNLKSERNGLFQQLKAIRRQAWFDLLGRYSKRRAVIARYRDVKTHLDLVSSNCNEVRLNGLTGIPAEQRLYPLGRFGAHVVGWTQTGDRPEKAGATAPLYGVAGIEKEFDHDLRGSPGMIQTRVHGVRELVSLRERNDEPVNGCDVRLTIDSNLQSLCQEVLERHTQKLSARGMAAVMVRPATGEILALASYPDFDLNDRRGLNDDKMSNRAVNQPNEPGSTFKMVGYSAALDLGKIHPGDPIFCENGSYTMVFGKSARTIHDGREHAMGSTTIDEAFAKSSNIGAVKVAAMLDSDVYLRYIRAFGYGSREGVACGGEDPGYIQKWEPMTQSSLAMGYGIVVTPLQTAMAYAAIANGGVLMRPLLVRSIDAADGRELRRFSPTPIRRVVKAETAREMTRLMRGVVEHGTGAKASLQDVDVAGKTGTGRKYNRGHNDDGSYKYYATFVGFFPAEAPEICLVVTVDEPANHKNSYYAAQSAAPAFKEIAQQVVSYLAIPAQQRPSTNLAGLATSTGSP
jgi:cell division protein FtsI/penicillin-binding protein 2